MGRKIDAPLLKLSGGAVVTADPAGLPGGGQALDLGYGKPDSAAGAEGELSAADLRSGAVSFFLKTDYDLMAPKGKDKGIQRNILYIPLKGGMYDGIRIFWYNTQVPYLTFYIHDGKQNAQTGLSPQIRSQMDLDTSAGVWRHIHVAWNSERLKMFIDGRLIGEKTLSSPLSIGAPEGKIILGAGNCKGRRLTTANALIADLRIWNSAEKIGLTNFRPNAPAEGGTAAGDDVAGTTLFVGGPGTQLTASARQRYFAPRFSAPPKIDGDLSDPVWKLAPRAGGFMKTGLEHPFADAQTLVQAGWDERNLYIAVTCFEDQMDKLKATASGPDSAPYCDDAVELFLAPVKGRISEFYQIVANTGTGTFDARYGAGGTDGKWNGPWKYAVKKQKDRWTAEFVIPYSSLNIPAPGGQTQWRWMIGRDRQAGGGFDQLTASAEMSGGFLEPREYNYLIFQDGSLDRVAEEKRLNSAYVAQTAAQAKSRKNTAVGELGYQRKTENVSDSDDGEIARIAEKLKSCLAGFESLLPPADPDVETCSRVRLEFSGFDRFVQKYINKVNLIRYSAVKVPADLSKGVVENNGCYYLSGDGMTAVVDTANGLLCGLFRHHDCRLIELSYDIYNTETMRDERRSDERRDIVESAKVTDDGGVELVCRNPQLNFKIVKHYAWVSAPDGKRRILSKKVSVSGNPAEKTLLTLTSRTYFTPDFKQQAEYHRVEPAGTIGDPRSVFPAAEIKNPIPLNLFFTHDSASILDAVNPSASYGIGQYWFKADGEWVIPCGSDKHKTMLTENGWDLSWMTTFITETPHTAELRYHFFTGDRVAFHQEYRDSPERLAALCVLPVSPEARYRRYEFCIREDIDDPNTRTAQLIPFLYARLRSNESISMSNLPNNDLWHGDYPVGYNAQLHTQWGASSPTYPAVRVKEMLRKAEKRYPRVLSGWYHIPASICVHSQFAGEHPEWILQDKNGKPVPSGWHRDFVCCDFSDAYWDEIIRRLDAQMDYFGERHMYLDYSIMGNVVDWRKATVLSSPQIRFLQKLYRDVQKRRGILFLNSQTFDGLHDIGYWEGFAAYERNGKKWRDVADSFMMRRLYDRQDVRTVPLYWQAGDAFPEKDRNYRDYTNLVLTHLLFPTTCYHDPYDKHFKDPKTGKTDWIANCAHSIPYFDFALEVGWTRYKEIGLSPAWWRDKSTSLEAYSFAKGDHAFIFTALRHEPVSAPPKDTVISFDFSKAGFHSGYRTFAWQFFTRDPDKIPRRAGIQNRPGWDQLFTRRTCSDLSSADGRAALKLDALEPFLTRIAVVTQVPAVFSAIEGKPLNILLPELLDSKVEGFLETGRTNYTLQVSTLLPATLLVYLPGKNSSVIFHGEAQTGKDLHFGDFLFREIQVPAGKSVIMVQ